MTFEGFFCDGLKTNNYRLLIFEQKYMVGSGLNQNLTSAHALVWVLDEWWLWKVSLRSYVSPLPFALFSY